MKSITFADLIEKFNEKGYDHATSIQQENIINEIKNDYPILVMEGKIVDVTRENIVVKSTLNNNDSTVAVYSRGSIEFYQSQADYYENEEHDLIMNDEDQDGNPRYQQVKRELKFYNAAVQIAIQEEEMYRQHSCNFKKGQLVHLGIKSYSFRGKQLSQGFLAIDEIDQKTQGAIEQKIKEKEQEAKNIEDGLKRVNNEYLESKRIARQKEIEAFSQKREQDNLLMRKKKPIDGVKGVLIGSFGGFWVGAILGFILSIGSCIFTGKAREEAYEGIGSISLALVGGIVGYKLKTYKYKHPEN